MDQETLRKVQLVQLEIAKEIKRVCDENQIDYFLACRLGEGLYACTVRASLEHVDMEVLLVLGEG